MSRVPVLSRKFGACSPSTASLANDEYMHAAASANQRLQQDLESAETRLAAAERRLSEKDALIERLQDANCSLQQELRNAIAGSALLLQEKENLLMDKDALIDEAIRIKADMVQARGEEKRLHRRASNLQRRVELLTHNELAARGFQPRSSADAYTNTTPPRSPRTPRASAPSEGELSPKKKLSQKYFGHTAQSGLEVEEQREAQVARDADISLQGQQTAELTSSLATLVHQNSDQFRHRDVMRQLNVENQDLLQKANELRSAGAVKEAELKRLKDDLNSMTARLRDRDIQAQTDSERIVQLQQEARAAASRLAAAEQQISERDGYIKELQDAKVELAAGELQHALAVASAALAVPEDDAGETAGAHQVKQMPSAAGVVGASRKEVACETGDSVGAWAIGRERVWLGMDEGYDLLQEKQALECLHLRKSLVELQQYNETLEARITKMQRTRQSESELQLQVLHQVSRHAQAAGLALIARHQRRRRILLLHWGFEVLARLRALRGCTVALRCRRRRHLLRPCFNAWRHDSLESAQWVIRGRRISAACKSCVIKRVWIVARFFFSAWAEHTARQVPSLT